MASSVGKCALCGKEGALEFEHIPPRSAFNKRRVREYSIEQLIEANRLPWEFEGLKYAENQRGSGLYSLCKSCNESTGSWYGTAYKIMTTHVIEGIKSLKNRSLEEYSIKIMDVFPARFLKQVISFCSVNCVDLGKSYFENIYFDELRAFVLQKDAVGLDTGNFKVCMAITKSDFIRLESITTVCMNDKLITFSDITAYPFQFWLFFDPPAGFEYEGVDITYMADFGFFEKGIIEIPFRLLEVNNFFPLDYRTKEEIKAAFSDAKKWAEK